MIPSTPRVVDQDGEHCQLVWEHVFLTYTIGPATDQNIASLVKNLERFFAGLLANRRGAFVLITRSSTRPPDSAARRQVQQVIERHVEKLAGIAVVIESSGFVNAIIRTVASSLFLIAPKTLPLKFFSTYPECASWVAERTGESATALCDLMQFAKRTVEDQR
jgi:hypothetical protein